MVRCWMYSYVSDTIETYLWRSCENTYVHKVYMVVHNHFYNYVVDK